MAATIKIIKVCGNSGYETETEVTDCNLKDIDDATTLITDSPIEILAVGTNYSFESWLRFKVTVAPNDKCENFKIWSDGLVIGTGVAITINIDAVNNYATPVKIQSTRGTRDNFKNCDVGSKIDVAGTLVGVGDKTNFMIFQLEVAPTAALGEISDICNYSYDEQ